MPKATRFGVAPGDGRDGSSRGSGYETYHKEDEYEARESTTNANREDIESIRKLDLSSESDLTGVNASQTGKHLKTIGEDVSEALKSGDQAEAAAAAAPHPVNSGNEKAKEKELTEVGAESAKRPAAAPPAEKAAAAAAAKKEERDRARAEKKVLLAQDKEKQLRDQEEDKAQHLGSEAAHATSARYMHDLDPPVAQDPSIHGAPGKPAETKSTYGGPEDPEDRLPADIPEGTGLAFWAQDWISPELKERWESNEFIIRAKRNIKSVDMLERGTIFPTTEYTEEEADKLERALAQTTAEQVVMNHVEEFDVDPWSPPCVKGYVFGPECLTLISPEPVWIPPRPLPPDHLEAALAQTDEMLRSGLAV